MVARVQTGGKRHKITRTKQLCYSCSSHLVHQGPLFFFTSKPSPLKVRSERPSSQKEAPLSISTRALSIRPKNIRLASLTITGILNCNLSLTSQFSCMHSKQEPNSQSSIVVFLNVKQIKKKTFILFFSLLFFYHFPYFSHYRTEITTSDGRNGLHNSL
ncbi:hypothetical protein VP01_1162g6 [Puccinia sorghi]|uniref:Uncharacterized protein n=1 Tax=Puccinia sorghi TaxID=27349 RepID=A0A0L6VRL6_9BASI|nr:hypothetical protein VP01_1162g6 [Puccinia sorghi]